MTDTDEQKDELESTAIMQAVGEALNQWSHIERNLNLLFDTLAQPQIYGVGRIVFNNIINFGARISIINDLFQAVESVSEVPDFERRLWNNLYNKLARQAKKRNEVGHFSVLRTWHQGKRIGPRLVPFFSTRLGSMGEQVQLTADDVRARANRFAELAMTIFWLDCQMLVAQGRKAENSLPEPGPVRALRALVARCAKGN